MLKKIMLAGVLLIWVSALKANGINHTNTFVQKTTLTNIDETLVNRLVADNDFKNYYTSSVKFANKIIESNAGSLFQKYIQNTASADEIAGLFAKMEVKSKKEFDAIAVNLKTEAVTFLNKFPELKLIGEKEQKEILVNAFKKISNDNSVAIKFLKSRTVTVEQCFWIWMACNGLCAMTCTYDPNYSDCMWQCTAACAASYGVCWLIAE